MILADITKNAIDPALAILPKHMDTPPARVMVLTIGLQESRLKERRQLVGDPPKPVGPAKGLWQFERGGGVRGCMNHHASKDLLMVLCKARSVYFDVEPIWCALEKDDVFAAGVARLLLWTDPHKLPAVNDVDGAWDLYMRVWRPGKPHIKTWAGFHRQAREFVSGAKA